MDPFELLGLTIDSSEEDIKKAYKKLSGKLHPDRNKAPDAGERFHECVTAYEKVLSLQNPDLKRAYLQGGWPLVEQIRNHMDRRANVRKQCPPFMVQFPVTLKQIYNHDTVTVEAQIPTYDDKGKQGSKQFKMDLAVSPMNLDRQIGIKLQGVERPDHITGDVVLEAEIDWEKEPTYFEIEGTNLVYHYKLSPSEVFSGFSFSLLHPNGKTYQVNDTYTHLNTNGSQIYVMPGDGLNSKDNVMNALIIIVSMDNTSFADTVVDTKKRMDLAELLKRPPPVPSKVTPGYVDVVKTSISLEEYERRKQQQYGGLPPGMRLINGGIQECNQQ